MVIGLVKFELRIAACRSLKGKRSVVKKIIERTRSRFNVSIAEVDKQDTYSRAIIGYAVVGSDQKYVNGAVEKILDFIDGLGLAEIISEELELINI